MTVLEARQKKCRATHDPLHRAAVLCSARYHLCSLIIRLHFDVLCNQICIFFLPPLLFPERASCFGFNVASHGYVARRRRKRTSLPTPGGDSTPNVAAARSIRIVIQRLQQSQSRASGGSKVHYLRFPSMRECSRRYETINQGAGRRWETPGIPH